MSDTEKTETPKETTPPPPTGKETQELLARISILESELNKTRSDLSKSESKRKRPDSFRKAQSARMKKWHAEMRELRKAKNASPAPKPDRVPNAPKKAPRKRKTTDNDGISVLALPRYRM